MMDKDMLEARLAEIRQMPPDQQAAALAALSRDYQAEQADLESQREFGMDQAGTGIAKGAIAGPSGNPYTAYMAASPLEHLASGLRTYKGMKDIRESRDSMKKLQEAEAAQRMAALQTQMGQPGPGQPFQMPGRTGGF